MSEGLEKGELHASNRDASKMGRTRFAAITLNFWETTFF